MAKPNIKQLSKMAFTKMETEREGHIEAASAEVPAAPSTYKPNQLAAALHPAVQHVYISKVIDRGPSFRSFVLSADTQAGTDSLAYFEAGQYISVEINMPAGKVVRPFSLCSSPQDALAGRYQLTIERIPGGYANDYVWDAWQEGTKLNISAPQGSFTYEPLRDAKQVVALVGGSAITPIYSMAKAIVEGTIDCHLTILYGTNTLSDAVLQDELKELEASSSKIKLVNVVLDETIQGCERGVITLDMVKKYAPPGPVSYFICGPQPMRRALEAWLPDLAVRSKFIRQEMFGEYRDPEADSAYPQGTDGAAPAPKTFTLTVRMAGQETTIDCNTHDTLLNSMEHAGIHAPARCRSGECGWCHSRLISGEVYIPERVDGRRAADKKFGYVHPCATFPLSDIVLEVPPFAY